MDGRSRTLTALAALACAVVVLLALALGDGPSGEVAGPPRPGPTTVPAPTPSPVPTPAPTSGAPAPTSAPPATKTVRIASFNVYTKMSEPRAQAAIGRLLGRGVDIVGVQEWNNSNRRAATRALVEAGWGVYSPVGDTAVVWNPGRYDLVARAATQNSESRDVGPPGPGSRTGRRTHAFWAATVRLRDRTSGAALSVTSIHHPAHVSLLGRPRVGITEARLAHRRRSEAVLAALVRAERAAVDHVFVTGDYNVDYRYDRTLRHEAFTESAMRSVGMVNAFARALPTRGTLGGGKLYDGVYADRHATSSAVLASGWGSDHRPVVARYDLPARPSAG